MGRPERPVDAAAGAAQRFALGLRELRRTAGNPTYRDMAGPAGFTATTLSKAAAGVRLPSLAVALGYVRACGGDPAQWELRWTAARATACGEPRDDEDAAPPYRGPARYGSDDRELFFGRERLVGEVRERVFRDRLAVVCGASGSGKSSLLRAGLIPRLREELAGRGRPAVLRVFTPGARPAETYGHLLAPGEGEPEVWAVVDRFEEVFTLCRDRAERARFVGLLLAARDPAGRLRVVVAVRSDFRARCEKHLAEVPYRVGPMDAGELRSVVIGPAQAAGLMVERELTARLVADVVDEPGGLAVLSHVLLETWRRRQGRTLTLASYEAAGGVRGAVAALAEDTYGRLPGAQARAARWLLLRMVEPGRDSPDGRRPLPRAELDQCADPELASVAEELIRARLLTADDDGLHLAHEALLTGWPRLRGWIEEDRERLRHHRSLTEAARVWVEHHRDSGFLYRGTRLARTGELFPGHTADPALTRPERAFLTAAFETREAEHRAAAQAARRSHALLVTLSAVLTLALIAVLVAWQQHDVSQRRRTDEAARRVAEDAAALPAGDPRTAMLLGVAAWRISRLPETRRALFGALAQPEVDTFTDPAPGDGPTRSLLDSGHTLLSVGGRTWRTWDVLTHRRTASGPLPSGKVLSTTPDGRLLVVRGDGGAVRLWDRVAGRWAGTPSSTAPSASASADLGEGGRSGKVRDGDTGTGRPVTEVVDQAVTHAALSPDGGFLATADGGELRVWRLSSPAAPVFRHTLDNQRPHDRLAWDPHRALLRYLEGGTVHTLDLADAVTSDWREHPLAEAKLSPDGRLLATAERVGDTYHFQLHDTGDGHLVRTLPGVPAPASAAVLLAFSSDGTALGYGVPRHFRVWDLTRGRERAVLDLAGEVVTVALGPGGRTLYAVRASTDGSPSAEAWDTRRRRRTAVLPEAAGRHLAVRPDGGLLVGDEHAIRLPSGGTDAPDPAVRLASGRTDAADPAVGLAPGGTDTPDPAVRLPSAGTDAPDPAEGQPVGALAFSPDGSRLAVGDRSGRVVLWDGDLRHSAGVLRNLFPAPLGDTPETVSALAFSPDGTTLAVGGDTGTLQLWDLTTRQPLGGPLTTPGEAVNSLSFSPDSLTLYSTGNHSTLRRHTLDPALAVTRVCARVGGTDLTEAQWRMYVPDVPYFKTCG